MNIESLKLPVIDIGITKLNKTDFDSILNISEYKLPNTDMYDTIAQFKMKTIEGSWLLLDVIIVNGEDELKKGLNIFVSKIEKVDSY
jgi:Zn-finger domain-containing protein